MKPRLVPLLLCLLLAAALVQAGLPLPADEVLILLPAAQAGVAQRIAADDIRLYARLPEGVLGGISDHVVKILERHRIPFEVIDRAPWSTPYAVLGSRRHALARSSYAGVDVRVMRSWDGHQLIKGTEPEFELLRERGYDVSAISRGDRVPPPPPERLVAPLLLTADSTVAAIISQVSDTSIRSSVQALQNFGTRYWTNANHDTVAGWVKGRYLAAGLADVQLDSFQYNGTWQKNVVATIPGSAPGEAEIIVGGHHDSYSSNLAQAPGADDNATGAAAALEMARVLGAVNYTPALTLRFMGFAAEEAGLIGSNRYAAAARTAARDIRAMLNYDMIGNRTQSSSDRDVFVVWYAGAEALRDLHGRMMQMYTTLTPVPTTQYRTGSDSYSFWGQSYPSVFCIERDFSPYYHSPNDLIQYLDFAYAGEVVRAGLATLLTLDMAPPPVAGMRIRDSGDGTGLVVAWDSTLVPDFATYRVYLGTEPGVYTQVNEQTTRSKSYTGLTTGLTYYAGVSIVDVVGREGMITERSAVPAVVPAPPAGVRIIGDSAATRMVWEPNLEVDLAGYHVYQSFAPPAFIRLTSSPVTDTVFTLPALDAWYYVTAVDQQGHESDSSSVVFASSTEVGESPAGKPVEFGLLQNYPNPFNGETRISYRLDAGDADVTLKVFNVLGQEVATLVQGAGTPGEHEVAFRTEGLPSGMYFAVLRSGAHAAQMKMVLMK